MSDSTCIGCGAVFPEIEGPTHRYLESSTGCWAAFCEVLAREYGDPTYFAIHRLTVDAYAVQHPGESSPQTIQSVAAHLLSLCLVLEHDRSFEQATQAMKHVAGAKGHFTWLTPPDQRGEVTVADILSADSPAAHEARVREWAQSAWQAWSPHHETVNSWVREFS